MTNLETIARRSGLAPAEIMLVARCFNGIEVGPPAAPELGTLGVLLGRNTLLANIYGEVANAHTDLDHSGMWLETFSEDPEQPFSLHDVAEKIEVMSEEQAAALLYFVLGWWAGVNNQKESN